MKNLTFKGSVPFLITGSLLWIGFILFNFYNPNSHPWFISVSRKFFSLTLFPLTLTLLLWGILRLKGAIVHNKIKFSINLWQLMLVGAGFLIFGFLITGITRGIIGVGDLFPSLIYLLSKYSVITLWLLILCLVSYLFGQRTLSLIKPVFPNKLTEILFSLGIGYAVFSFGLLFLSLLGILNSLGIGLLILVSIVQGIPFLRKFLGIFTAPVSVSATLISWESWWGWLLCLFVILNFSIALLPFPDGWDSLTFYFNLSKELAYTGSFVRGQYFYPAELVWAAAEILTKTINLSVMSETVAIQTATFGAFLAVLAIFNLGRLLKSTKVGIVSALLFASMPMIGFFSTLEPKVEVTMVFFMALSLTAFFLWRQNHNADWLSILAIVAAFSFLLKVTAAFMLVSIVLIWIIDWICYQKPSEKKQSLLQLPIAIGIALIIWLPWFGLHAWERGGKLLSPSVLITGQDNKVTQRGNLLSRVNLAQEASGVSTGYQEDYGRYLGPLQGWGGLEKYLPQALASIPMARYVSLPWAITMLSYRNDLNMSITSLFLALFPVILLAKLILSKNQHFSDKNLLLLTVLSIIYLLLWIIKGEGTTWYGIGMLIGFSVLLSAMIQENDYLPVILKRIMFSLLTLEIVVFLLIHVSRFGIPVYLQYGYGKLTKDKVEQVLLPSYQESTAIIEKDPQIASGKEYVLAVSTYLPHFLPDYRHILIDDPYLDQFSTLYLAMGKDNDRTLAALKQAGIRYIMIESSVFYSDQTKERTLEKKVLDFLEFASSKLILVQGNDKRGTLLLKVPDGL